MVLVRPSRPLLFFSQLTNVIDTTLLEIAAQRSASEHHGFQLAQVTKVQDCLHMISLLIPVKASNWKETFTPMETADSVWQMVCNRDSDSCTELVVHFQGVLCKSDLPPFLQKIA
jgi:hypothetical protein